MQTKVGYLDQRKGLLDVYTTANKDDYEKYVEQFNSVFLIDDINTIAIIGGYGAGKSTLVKTYEKKKNKKFCYISALPYSFNGDSVESPKNESNVRTSKSNSISLEQKIIEQIYNQVSNREHQKVIYSFYPIISLITLGITLVYFVGKKIEYLKLFWNSARNALPLIPTANVILLFILIFWIVYTIYLQSTTPGITSIIDRIKMPSIELQLRESNVGFDKVTTELIRLLSKSKFDAVVVEDLDRFVDKAVIFQLREFANLYNRSTKNNTKFIFLLDFNTIDDEKLRAKFFDYSINVVPYMSFSYSYSYVKEIQKLSEDLGSLSLTYVSDDLIRVLTTKIHDSRLLRIILSDYIFLSESYYGDKIINSSLKDNERTEIENLLLSLSIYKHVLTNDYNNFLKSEGNLYSLLITNENKATNALKDTIKTLQDEVKASKLDILEDEKELLIVEAVKLFQPSFFTMPKPEDSSIQLYSNYLKNALASDRYLERANLLKENYEMYLLNKQNEIDANMMRIAYYVPKGDIELVVDWTENDTINELMRELLFKGYLSSKINIYISNRSDTLTPEETRLVERAVSFDIDVDPSIKINEDNIPTIMSLIDLEKLKVSNLFNYDMMNFFRKGDRYNSEYRQMLDNLQKQVTGIVIDNAFTFFSNAYFGMARKSNEIYELLLKDSKYFSESFIEHLFKSYLHQQDFKNQICYFLLIALLTNESVDDVLKIDSFVKFINSDFEIKTLESAISRIQISENEIKKFEDQIMQLILSQKIKIEFERFDINECKKLFNNEKERYQYLLREKIKKYQFKISKRLISAMFFFTSSKDAKYLDLNLDNEDERKMIDFLLKDPHSTRDSLLAGARPFDEQENIKFWLSTKKLEQLDFTVKLINALGIEESEPIFNAIENYSSDKVPSKYREEYEEYDGTLQIRWFTNLSKLAEEIANEVIFRDLYIMNQVNVEFIFDLFLKKEDPSSMLDVLLNVDYSLILHDVLNHKYYKEFFIKLIECSLRQREYSKFDILIGSLPTQVIKELKLSMEDNIDDLHSKGMLIEHKLIIASDEILIFILSEGNDEAIARYHNELRKLIQNRNDLINKLFNNINIQSSEKILDLISETNQFNPKTFKEFEEIRAFTSISNNTKTKTFRKPIDKKTIDEINILESKGLVKVTVNNEDLINIRIKWQVEK